MRLRSSLSHGFATLQGIGRHYCHRSRAWPTTYGGRWTFLLYPAPQRSLKVRRQQS